MDKRRQFISFIVLSGFMLVMLGRLCWIQLLDTTSYSAHSVNLVENSVAQREQSVVLNKGRGDFYDALGQRLTGENIYCLLVTPPSPNVMVSQSQREKIAAILHIKLSEWLQFTDQILHPALFKKKMRLRQGFPLALADEQVAAIQQLQYPGVIVVPYERRYPNPYAGGHLLGYIHENPQRIREIYQSKLTEGEMVITDSIGGSGLEKTFDSFLQSMGQTTISAFHDAKGNPMLGNPLRKVKTGNAFYPLKIITTLDKQTQIDIEKALDNAGIKEAAVVVLDANNADLIAMASRPQYDPLSIDLAKGNWANLALKAMTPGSIYKTVVAAAALESGKVQLNEKFDCTGSLGKYGFSCWLAQGHGHISFMEGYAQSCNIVFAKLMERLTADQLYTTAERLGLFNSAGWRGKIPGNDSFKQLDQEENGQLFAPGTDIRDEGLLIQSAIGQRDVLITPLQAANLVVTLLHQGEVMAVRAVSQINYQNNRPMLKFKTYAARSRNQGISRRTSRILLQAMVGVVTEGTGKNLQHAKWHLAGKSGTAEIQVKGEPKENHWFIGYGPFDHPRYTVSVVVQNVNAGSHNQATELFRKVMDILAEE